MKFATWLIECAISYHNQWELQDHGCDPIE